MVFSNIFYLLFFDWNNLQKECGQLQLPDPFKQNVGYSFIVFFSFIFDRVLLFHSKCKKTRHFGEHCRKNG
jgi:hypothetical protein